MHLIAYIVLGLAGLMPSLSAQDPTEQIGEAVSGAPVLPETPIDIPAPGVSEFSGSGTLGPFGPQ